MSSTDCNVWSLFCCNTSVNFCSIGSIFRVIFSKYCLSWLGATFQLGVLKKFHQRFHTIWNFDVLIIIRNFLSMMPAYQHSFIHDEIKLPVHLCIFITCNSQMEKNYKIKSQFRISNMHRYVKQNLKATTPLKVQLK